MLFNTNNQERQMAFVSGCFCTSKKNSPRFNPMKYRLLKNKTNKQKKTIRSFPKLKKARSKPLKKFYPSSVLLAGHRGPIFLSALSPSHCISTARAASAVQCRRKEWEVIFLQCRPFSIPLQLSPAAFPKLLLFNVENFPLEATQ